MRVNPFLRPDLAQIGTHVGSADAAERFAEVVGETLNARQADRLCAKQRIKAFLFRIAGHVESSAWDVLQKYVEAKLGV